MQPQISGLNKISMLKKLLFLLPICLLLTSCSDDFIFEKTMKTDDGNWSYEDVLQFDFTIADTSKKYDLLLEVEHAGDYGYQNLYVQFHTKFPSGEKKTQLVSLELASKSGIWNGQCSGNTCTVEIPLQTNTVFEETGEHSISVEQYMRENPLPSVAGMTLKIRPSGVE